MFGTFVAGGVVGISVAVLVVFAAVSVMETAATRGFPVGMVAGLGVATGDALWAGLLVTAGAAVDRLLADWTVPLYWAAVVALGIVGIRAVRDVRRPDRVFGAADLVGQPPMRTYGEYLGATLRDVVTVVFFCTLMLETPPRYAGMKAVAFVGGAFLGTFAWQSAMAVVGARRGRDFTARGRRAALVIDGVLLGVFIAYVIALAVGVTF